MKCSACIVKDCDRKYENRDRCVGRYENIKCACICQVSGKQEAVHSILSVVAGAGTVAGGVALTIFTAGIGVPGGAALIGAGSSMIMKPIKKRLAGERMTMTDSAQKIIRQAKGTSMSFIISFMC
jgi:hypothetical protein